MYNSLIYQLSQLIKGYRLLVENLRQEKEYLATADIAQLNENNSAKEIILLELRTQEKTRVQITRELAATIGADVESPRLLDIAQILGGPEEDKLRNLHSVLELLVKRASEINEENEQLAHSAIKQVQGALNSIRDSLGPKPVYEKKGSISNSTKSGKLVSREV